MKFVKLQQTAIIGGVPRSPAEGEQLVTDEQAKHMVEHGQVLKDDVQDAKGVRDPSEDHSGAVDEDGGAFKRAVAAAVKKAVDKAFDEKVAAEVEKQVAARNQADFDAAVAAEVKKQTGTAQ